jgi:hypothetical protein
MPKDTAVDFHRTRASQVGRANEHFPHYFGV